MHGRVKVRTTKDERERKKKEQILKVNAYKKSMKIIMDKRNKNEYDEEMMELTKLLLLRASDISTLWNVRKQCILQKIENLKAKDINIPLDDEKNGCIEKQIQKVFDKELLFTEQCLPSNPKSYCTWYQRYWAMENSPCANWRTEVDLCKKYLSLDERNFHTWNFYRYSAVKAQIAKNEELEFSSEQIKINFSNYSSWHHRSLLLPILLFPQTESDTNVSIEDSKLHDELDMVLTAIFTDPNDSSAWFYQNWLLGYSRPGVALFAFRANKDKAVLSFTKSVCKDNIKAYLKRSNNQVVKLNNWLAVNNTAVDCVFYTSVLPEGNILDYQYLEVFISDSSNDVVPLKFCKESIYCVKPMKTEFYTPNIINYLKSHLEYCENLLKYEPDSKWTLLTTAVLMRAVDYKCYHEKILEYLKKLQIIDHLRKNYYEDLASKWVMESTLIDWSFSKEIPLKLDLYDLKQLKTIAYPQCICIADEIVLNGQLKLRYPKLLTFQNI